MSKRLSSKERSKEPEEEKYDFVNIEDKEVDIKEAKKEFRKIERKNKEYEEMYTIPPLEYEDREVWKGNMKLMEKALEEFIYKELNDPCSAFPLKTLTNLEGLIAEHFLNLLQGKHKLWCENQAKIMRMGLQAASSAYVERVRDESGFLLAAPYASFNFSVAKHMMIGVCLEITNSENFKFKRGIASKDRTSLRR